MEPSSIVESVATALIFAWIAGRLLGAARRGWKAVVVTGIGGWLVALVFALAVVGGDVDHPSFGVFYFVFILLFIMLATVIGEIWIRPGRVRGARTFSIPHPIRLVKRRYALTKRLTEITRIAIKYGLGGFLGLRRSRRAGPAPAVGLAARASQALEEAGGMFVKLGQLAAGRGDLIGDAAAAEFAKLQDAVPPASSEEVRALVEEEIGRSVEEAFSDFDWDPVGAASIGQAHLARLHDGRRVIVKVQRPGIAEVVDRDLQIVARLAAIAEKRTSWGAAYGVTALVEDFSENLRQELDYRVEAENAEQVARAIADVDLIHVPSIDRSLSTARVMVMELLDGEPLSKAGDRSDWRVDRRELADAMLRASVEPMVHGDRFHADPHPGNVFLLRDGRLGLVDFGATGRLDAFEQVAVTDIMIGLQMADPELLREAVLSISTLRREVDGRALERSLARFMARHISAGAKLGSAMLNELLQMLTSFGILLPASTSAMFRALVTLEGTLNRLVPGYPLIEAAQAIGGDLVREQYGEDQLKEIAQQEVIKLVPVLRRIPRHMDRIAALAQQGELTGRISLFSTERDVAVVKDLLGRIILVVVGLTFMLVSVLLIRTEGGPSLTGETSMFEMLGYVGSFLGLILLLRVTLSALRDTGAGRVD